MVGSSNACILSTNSAVKLIAVTETGDSLAGGHAAGLACYSPPRNSRIFRGHTEACPVARARQRNLTLRPKSQAFRQRLCQRFPDLPPPSPYDPTPAARGPLPPPVPCSLPDHAHLQARRPPSPALPALLPSPPHPPKKGRPPSRGVPARGRCRAPRPCPPACLTPRPSPRSLTPPTPDTPSPPALPRLSRPGRPLTAMTTVSSP